MWSLRKELQGLELGLEKQELKKGKMANQNVQDYVYWKLEQEDYKASNSKKHSAHPGSSTWAYKSGPPCITAVEASHHQPNSTAEPLSANSST